MLLAKVLGLNETQESEPRLVFHYADDKGLPLLDLERPARAAAPTWTRRGQGGAQGHRRPVEGDGRRHPARRSSASRTAAATEFFGEPEFDITDLMRIAPDGRGDHQPASSCRPCRTGPALFSTVLMWLLAELFEELPEVGDLEKPKLVFFFDEAHLLFNGATKAFLDSVTQTVRLIRSKGVGVFFVTQAPKDVPADVLGQLGNRVQHALRAFTPDDAKALKAAVNTYPKSDFYDIEALLTQLGIGEAAVTILTPRACRRRSCTRACARPLAHGAGRRRRRGREGLAAVGEVRHRGSTRRARARCWPRGCSRRPPAGGAACAPATAAGQAEGRRTSRPGEAVAGGADGAREVPQLAPGQGGAA